MKRLTIAFLHLLFWLVYLFMMMVTMYLLLDSNEEVQQLSEENTARLVLSMVLLPSLISFYLFYFLFFPRYFQQKQYLKAILGGLLVSLITTFLGYSSLGDILSPYCLEDHEALKGMRYFYSFINLFCCLGALVIRGFSNWFEQVEQKETLLVKNHEMQLALLKSQLDPHFLFNTINNIDVLILKNAEEASNYLNRLSDIIRFMLFETQTDKILLSQEVAYIDKYITLQKIRTANKDYVSFTVIGDPSNRKIAPMVLIPFVENAFKHTTNKKTPNAISISIKIEAAAITLLCANKFNPDIPLKQNSNGLGNELIKKRLNLLYPQKHSLNIKEEGGEYIVHLTINN